MMRTTKIILLLLFPFITEVFISCCRCEEPEVKQFTHNNIKLFHLELVGAEPQLAQSDSVKKNAYGIRLQIDRELLSYQWRQFNLFQSNMAYACKCPQSYMLIAKDSITDIEIVTQNDFDASHPAQSDIADYFQVSELGNMISMQDFLNSLKATNLYTLDMHHDMILMTAPTLNTMHSFKVRLTTSDGRILEAQTSVAKLY